MEFYKVLKRTEEDQLVSGYTGDPEPEEQKWANPRVPGSRLFVFTDLAMAWYWAGYNPVVREVWRVKVEGVELVPTRVSGWWDVEMWKTFWANRATFADDYATACLVDTAFASRVLLTERVERV